MKRILFFLMWLSVCNLQAQVKQLHTADSLYLSFNYSAAASLYAQLTGGHDSVVVFRRLAQCYRKQGDYLLENRTLLRIPTDSLTHNDMRQLYYSYSNLQDSVAMEQWGEKILQLFPYDADITASVAVDLMQKNEVEAARNLTMHYLEKDSANFNVWRQYAYSCYLLNRYEEAQRAYLKLNDNGWNSYEVNVILGICYGEQDDADNAYNYLVKANRIKKGKDILVLKMLATNCMKIGKSKEAVEYMEQAINIAIPDSAELFNMYNGLAEAHFNLQDYAQAATAFINASKYQPTRAITYYNIAQMYNGLKDMTNMVKYYKLFLQYSSMLQDTDDNREMIERVKAFLAKRK